MSIFLETLIVALAINIILFLVAFRRGTDKLTDFAYGATFITVTIFAIAKTGASSVPSYVLLGLVTLWAVRLGLYLVMRIRKINRDKRFDGIRENFRKFGSFWVAQAVSAWVILLPTIYFFLHPKTSFNTLMILGILVWAVGFYFESVSDMQKFEFINNPKNKGKWIEEGLWKRSRHPNYFGEITMWVGIYLFCVTAMSLSVGVLMLVSPALISFVLIRVSGIPKLEVAAEKRWGNNPEYRKYRDNTPILLPKL